MAKESAVAGCAAAGSFDRIQAAALIPADAFIDTRWRIVYCAAYELRIAGTPVCAESVSDFIAFHDLDKEFQYALDSTRTFDWRHWPDHADQSLAFSPSPQPIEYCLSELGYLYSKRQVAQIATRLQGGDLELQAAITSLQEIAHQSNGNNPNALPITIQANMLCSNPPQNPPELIAGVLHQGGKMALGGGSKSFKTWTLLEMAICIASGLPWWKFETAKTPVCYVNFELPSWAMAARITEICQAMEIIVPAELLLWNLRGYASDATLILPKIAQASKEKGFGAIFLDPLYKLLGNRDENAAHDMANLMNTMEHLAVEIDSAVIFGGHYSKGNQSAKESLDRISGSGVFARDPDTIFTMTAHEKNDAFTIDMTLRNFPQQDSFVVRRSHPLMIVDGQLDPAKLKKPPHKNTGRPREHEPDQALDCLRNNMTSLEWENACEEAGIPRRTYYRLRKELIIESRVFESQIDGKWCRK